MHCVVGPVLLVGVGTTDTGVPVLGDGLGTGDAVGVGVAVGVGAGAPVTGRERT